jgi:hypothetical protein
VTWALAWVASTLGARGVRALGETDAALRALRRSRGPVLLRHLALALSLLTGLALLRSLSHAASRAAWIDLKIGLVAFLLLPLEGMHAYVCHLWIARGLRATPAPPFAQDLARGLGMEEMIRALEVPLLGAGVPLLVWLSMAKPGWP